MTPTTRPSEPFLRRSVYAVLILASVGWMLGRILAVDSVDVRGLEKSRLAKIPSDLAELRSKLQSQGLPADQIEAQLASKKQEWERKARLRRPFLSANDRSRWCTVRALVEPEMRVPGAPYAIDRVIEDPLWDTIDKVKHDGQGHGGLGDQSGHFYSSKPPLFPTLLALLYWIIYQTTGATLGTHPYEIGRLLLVLVNVIPLGVYLWLVGGWAERFGRSEWGRVFVVASACFATFLSTFSVVLNNHVPAAVCVAVALDAAFRIVFDAERRLRYFVLAGLFGAFAVADELPVLAFFAPLGLVLLAKEPRRTLLGFLPAALIIAAGFFGTNWIAHKSLKPPYAHRSTTDPKDNWYHYTYQREGKTYTSYWQRREGIDRGEPSRAVYALHALVGHHGVFSLTPIWILSLVGLAIWLVRPEHVTLRGLALLVALVSVLCLGFYIGVVDQPDRNYGGMTSGLRWSFWMIPLWLVLLFPGADWAATRRGWRIVALGLLAASAVSASYPTWNPWTHPWLYDYFEYLGWLPRT